MMTRTMFDNTIMKIIGDAHRGRGLVGEDGIDLFDMISTLIEYSLSIVDEFEGNAFVTVCTHLGADAGDAVNVWSIAITLRDNK